MLKFIFFAAVVIAAVIFIMFMRGVLTKEFFVRKAVADHGKTRGEVLYDFDQAKVLADAYVKDILELGHVQFVLWPTKDLKYIDFTTPTVCRIVVFPPSWIYHLASPEGEKWRTAFVQSVGHECGHTYDPFKDLFFYFRRRSERRLFYYLREVRNDFLGTALAEKALGVTRKCVLSDMLKKVKIYTFGKKDEDHFRHPAWKFRRSMLKKYDRFDERVCDAIHKRSKCQNDAYYQRLKAKFLSF